MIEGLFIAATQVELECAWLATGKDKSTWPIELAEAQNAGYAAPCVLVDGVGNKLGGLESTLPSHTEQWAFAVTGVGIPLTVLRLSSLLSRLKPKRVIQIGIAGAFANSTLSIGDVVIGKSESFGDLGLELPESADGFLPLDKTSFADAVSSREYLLPSPPRLPVCPGFKTQYGKGLTVNAVGGTLATAQLRGKVFGADFESMEGAAAALACAAVSQPFIEIRGISNIVGPRDMQPKNISLALSNLKQAVSISHNEKWK